MTMETRFSILSVLISLALVGSLLPPRAGAADVPRISKEDPKEMLGD